MARRTALRPLTMVGEYRRPALTARGLAVVHALRLAEAVRDLDGADREYVAPLVADILVDVATDVPPAVGPARADGIV